MRRNVDSAVLKRLKLADSEMETQVEDAFFARVGGN